MKYVIIIARVLLGLVFVVFGSNAFFHFIPQQPMPEKAAAFMMPLISSGYYYPIAILQILGGICLLTGARFVPLGLTLLGPIILTRKACRAVRTSIREKPFLPRTPRPQSSCRSFLAAQPYFRPGNDRLD